MKKHWARIYQSINWSLPRVDAHHLQALGTVGNPNTTKIQLQTQRDDAEIQIRTLIDGCTFILKKESFDRQKNQ